MLYNKRGVVFTFLINNCVAKGACDVLFFEIAMRFAKHENFKETKNGRVVPANTSQYDTAKNIGVIIKNPFSVLLSLL